MEIDMYPYPTHKTYNTRTNNIHISEHRKNPTRTYIGEHHIKIGRHETKGHDNEKRKKKVKRTYVTFNT
jgi:hypothetical protein